MKPPSIWRANLERIYPFLILVFLQTLSFGIFTHRLGFYHDDWYNLEVWSRAENSWRLACASGHWTRPAEYVLGPALFAVGGLSPLPYHILILLLQTVESLLLFVFFERLTGWRPFALIAAALALMYPNRAITHVWFSGIPQILAQGLVLGSLLSHLHWIGSRQARHLLLSQALYLLSLLSYESCMFMPAMLAGGLLRPGGRPAACIRQTLRDIAPYLVTLALALSWQWLAVPRLFQAGNPKSHLLGFSALHALEVYWLGLQCVTTKVFQTSFADLPDAVRNASWTVIALWAAFTAGAVGVLEREVRATGLKCPQGGALGAALAGFVAAYAPYAVSRGYPPLDYGPLSRVNGCGAWIGGLVLATCIFHGLQRKRWLSTAALAVVIGAFTWNNWYTLSQWQRSWMVQKDILTKARQKVAHLPGPAMIMLTDYPLWIKSAFVFAAPWDFGSALSLSTGRRDISGATVASRKTEQELEGFRRNGRLYLYDYGHDTLTPDLRPQTP